MERTLVLVKPDGVQRGLIGEIISRLEARGLQLVGMKFMQLSREMAEAHYGEHQGKPFFNGLVEFITSAPLVAMVWQGDGVISIVRTTMGKTNPADAAPGTIRGDLAISLGMNVIHGSDSAASAEREIDLFFAASEICEWSAASAPWIA